MKKWGHLSRFHVSLLELGSLNCPKKCIILQFCVGVSKKSKSVKEIYIYASESSHYTLSENDMVYRGPSHCS